MEERLAHGAPGAAMKRQPVTASLAQGISRKERSETLQYKRSSPEYLCSRLSQVNVAFNY